MNKIAELFGYNTSIRNSKWKEIINNQFCPYTNKKCYKIRKSEPNISIGTCTVRYGSENIPVIICPKRLLHNQKVFIDSLHLLQLHQPGNDIHIVPEISLPGGSVDYVIASVKNQKVIDFVGVEFQTLDTTGTVWPERQRLLKSLKVFSTGKIENKTFGMNWKMTAKTILVQMHHKIETFENLNKHFVLVVQDYFLDYMKKEFSFDAVNNPAVIGDCCHFHSYSFPKNEDMSLILKDRISTDSAGIAKCLGLNAEAKVELQSIIDTIQKKISEQTLLKINLASARPALRR